MLPISNNNHNDNHNDKKIAQVIGTALEQLAVVYVVMPLLPPASHPYGNSAISNTMAMLGQSGDAADDMYYLHGHSTVAYGAGMLPQHTPLILLPKVMPKSHEEAQAPSNQEVMHAALALAGLHWCLSRGLCIEMNPPVTIMIAVLRQRQHEYADKAGEVWSMAAVALWGQFVGTVACVAFVALFAPRHTKFWPGILASGGPKREARNV
jgi:hypothetical protein